ncbi:MAG: tetratricopeptide repeat protein [Anaerolineae bacterium]|nr:tetratricopeptide repeat protein [Anaerolineae bacterium]
METPISFGGWLKEQRKKLGLTQADLGNCAGCTAATIRKIEAEERRPSRQVAELLAKCLHVPAEQHALFLQVARGERRVDRLAQNVKMLDVPTFNFTSPAASLTFQPFNLPTPLTPLLGRDHELLAIARLLDDPQCRLLTLVGPGGIGKTRLSLQVAAQQQKALAHGVAFVSLAPLTGREQIITAIADTLGIVLYVATDRAEQLVHYLREKRLLLILDNFEHMLGDEASVALVGDLIGGAPMLKLLVTSREPLHLRAEWVFEVQGLPIPESEQPGELEASSAVKLFLQRAQQARVGFSLTPADRPAVLRICQLVEGLPLGIELAAAWVLTLSCQEIARELENSLADPLRGMDFLVTATRDIPERHRSINAVFDHSWKLLSVEEQRVLRQLSVFQGGFGREAAAYVAGASLPLLSALVSKSLLRRSDAAAGRYDWHELVRQSTLARLQMDPQEYSESRDRHCHYYTALLERRGPALKGANRSMVVAELLADIANLRLAWNWAATRQQSPALSRAADTLFWLYESRSNCREGVPLFGQAVQSLQAKDGSPTGLAANIDPASRLALGQTLNYQGFFCFRQGQHPQGRELLQHSLALLRPLAGSGGDLPARVALSDTAAFLGTVMSVMGDYPEGYSLLHEGLSLKRALGDPWGTTFCLRQLGLAAYSLGEYDEAHRLLAESLALSREMGNTWAIASSLNALSMVAYAQGSHHEARQLLQEGLALGQGLEDRYTVAVSLNGLGLISQALGDGQEAQRFFQESIALWREIGDQGDLAASLNNLGETLLVLENLPESRRCFLEALTVAQETQVMPVALDALIGLAAWHIQTGAAETALELVTHVLQHPVGTQTAKARAERLLETFEANLSPGQKAIRTQTPAKSFETVIKELLQS